MVKHQLATVPDLTRLAAMNPARYPCLLQSHAAVGSQSRWDILFAFPQSSLVRDADGRLWRDDVLLPDGDFLTALDDAWQAESQPVPSDGLPFHGGWVLLLGYELAADIEPSLELPTYASGLPTAMALRCPVALLLDRHKSQAVVVAETDHAECLAELLGDLQRASEQPVPLMPPPRSLTEDPAQDYLDAVEQAREHIAAGDVFQVNLARRWQARFDDVPIPAAVHGALCKSNPAPFAGLWQQPGWAVISSSPERLLELRGRDLQTRPIAGTRPRISGDDELARRTELLSHPKERAEHVMLIDLERNDLGRVCRSGSVEVNELMVVETHPHVHHIVSNVRGRLRRGVTPAQVIAACFPGGTITGCPKIRCMQIIAALEARGRGAYTGSLGYLDHNGDMDLNILIRSFQQQGKQIEFHAGAGIVHDSVPELELAETRAKAHGLLRALGR